MTLETRRVPKQQRSRERYERILEAARGLIAEHGNDAVSMREIADHAKMGISSVYQYFPDKNALLWTLISAHFESIETRWHIVLEKVDNIAQLNAAALWLFDEFVQLCESDPAFARLWGSVQANVVLNELDRDLNRRIAGSFTAKAQALAQTLNTEAVWRNTYLLASLSSTALQLAFAEPAHRNALLDDFRRLIATQALTE
ncbi:MAG: TetR/AcrR family transcriptional regulator [Pseudomonadota bacterium]